MKRVYTHYQDGQTWIDDHTSETWVEIHIWQWVLYQIFSHIDCWVHHWCIHLDNIAYEREHGPQ